jgi:hypothetical protein
MAHHLPMPMIEKKRYERLRLLFTAKACGATIEAVPWLTASE